MSAPSSTTMTVITDADKARFFSKIVDSSAPAHVSHLGPCKLWQGAVFKDGYGAFKVGGSAMRAHRVAYMIVYGHLPATTIVRHRCDVRTCVNYTHLLPGTVLDNNLDKIKRGRSNHAKGEDFANARLDEAKVARLRALAATKRYTIGALAGMFGVNRRTIYHVLEGTSWQHVKADT